MKRSFFQAAVVSILLYGGTTWTLTKHMKKKLDSNYTKILREILNKSWRQHPTKQQLNGHLPPITKTIKIRRTRHTGHCLRSRDELISDVPQGTPSQGRAKAGCPDRTYIQQLCANTGCTLEDLPEAMDNREVWRERVRNIRADSVTWWWWYSFKIIHMEYIQVKLVTVVEGDQKAPFSIASTPRCREGHYSFPWIDTLYPWYVPYIAEC